MPHAARMSVSPVSSVLTILAWLGGTVPAVADGPVPRLETQLRRPVALLTTGDLLLVGNRRSGTITVVDPTSGTVLAEHPVAKRIADMARLDDDGHLVVLDDAGERLWKVSLQTEGKPPVQSIATVPSTATKRPSLEHEVAFYNRVLKIR